MRRRDFIGAIRGAITSPPVFRIGCRYFSLCRSFLPLPGRGFILVACLYVTVCFVGKADREIRHQIRRQQRDELVVNADLARPLDQARFQVRLGQDVPQSPLGDLETAGSFGDGQKL